MGSTQFYGTGKRKTSVARVWITEGEGEILVNKRKVDEYFPREALLKLIKEPLEATNLKDRFNIMANIRGGGLAGQAWALRHGIARALLQVNPDLRDVLKKNGFLTRDSRIKERKKYGQKGARKRFQYSKR